jgi:hypothetical protein
LTQAILIGGLFIGVLSSLPIINIANCCCVWILGGGALTAYLAQQDDPEPLGLLAGARLGLLAGIVGAVIGLVVSIALNGVVAPLQQRAAEIMLGNATDMPPEVRRWVESIGDRASAPQRLVARFFFQLFVATPFASLGGLLGTAIFGRQTPPVHGEP